METLLRPLNRKQVKIVHEVIDLLNTRFEKNKIEGEFNYFMLQNLSDILHDCNLTCYDDERIDKFFKEFKDDLLPF